MDKVRINLIHPTNMSELLTVAVPQDATAAWIVTEMINAGFIPQASSVGAYKLEDTRTGMQLNDNQTLLAAGVHEGTSLQVFHNTTGAR
jgi:hypothetical protein